MMNWLVDRLIARAKRTPYTHLYHGDGSAYMERYWLRGPDKNGKWPRIAVRIHWIATPDHDRVLHDHPWAFISIVLRGHYNELRPVDRAPCFPKNSDHESTYYTWRRPGSVAFRWWTDRHRINYVSPGGVWTFFISFPYRQWWGFYTKHGKVYYKDYETVHVVRGEVEP